MCNGLCDDNDNSVNVLDAQHWMTFAVKQICPSKDEYINEVTLHWNCANSSGIACEAWPTSEEMELAEN